MTNGEKYKTVEERTEAFDMFCHAQTVCGVCKLRGTEDYVNKMLCAFRWLNTNDTPKEPVKTPSLKALIVSYRAIADMMDAHKLPQPTPQYLRTLLDRVEAACRRAYDEINSAVSVVAGISFSEEDFIRGRMDETIGDYKND